MTSNQRYSQARFRITVGRQNDLPPNSVYHRLPHRGSLPVVDVPTLQSFGVAGRTSPKNEAEIMKAPLRDAIESALGGGSLTHREITEVINRQRLYLPKDGTLVAVAQVRAAVREHSKVFDVDRGSTPHRVEQRKNRLDG